MLLWCVAILVESARQEVTRVAQRFRDKVGRSNACVAHPRRDVEDGRKGCLGPGQGYGLRSEGHPGLLRPLGNRSGFQGDERVPASCGEADPWFGGEGIWIIKLKSGDYCKNYGDREAVDTEMLIMTEASLSLDLKANPARDPNHARDLHPQRPSGVCGHSGSALPVRFRVHHWCDVGLW